jgi:hypothetical protein
VLYRPEPFEPLTQTPWNEGRAAVDGSSAESALAIAREVGARLRDPDVLARATEAWRPIELAQGHPGLAVLFAQLDARFPREGWSDAAHSQIELAVAALRREPNAATGLMSGLAGLAFAADLVDGKTYVRLLLTLDGLIERRTKTIVERVAARESGVVDDDIDLVSGLSGIGAYFLARGNLGALRPILEQLVRLVGTDGPVPLWHTPPALLRDEETRRAFPAGQLNYGLAHGLPGPLALLALSRRAGIEMAGLADAVRRASTWLLDHAVEDECGLNWPGLVPVGSDPTAQPPTRAAWCYGAPGVARALWLAGVALENSELQAVAVAALEAVHRRPPEVRKIDAPTFCHGLAGLLQITLRMANESDGPELRRAAQGLTEQVVDRFDPDSILGYRDLDRDGRAVDHAGLLQGAAGTALVLLAAAAPVTPRWDRAFLLA